MLSIVEASVSAQPTKTPKAVTQSGDTSSGRDQFASHLDDGANDSGDTQSSYGLAQGEDASPTSPKDNVARELNLATRTDIPSDVDSVAAGESDTDANTTKLSDTQPQAQARTDVTPENTNSANDRAIETAVTPDVATAKGDASTETGKVQTQLAAQAIDGETPPRPSGGQTQDDTPQNQAANAETAAKPTDAEAEAKTNTALPTLSAALDAKALTAQGTDTSATQISTDFTTTTATQTAAPSTTTPALALVRAVPLSTPAMIAPTDIPNILTQTLSSPDKQTERVIVQLDPPELGRVSLDFKFDGGTLQAVTITGETPEALRQLRLMHFELINSLEQQGLSGSDLTFSHQQFSDQSEQAAPFSTLGNPEGEYTNVSLEAIQGSRQQISNSNGLDIKL